MIRRGFWLLIGAALGVTGYRRVTRLARLLTVPRSAGSLARSGRAAPAHGARSPVARAVAAAGFVRDVRDGMAEYWELHRGDLDPVLGGRTLEGQSDRTSSGERQQGPREP